MCERVGGGIEVKLCIMFVVVWCGVVWCSNSLVVLDR